MKKYITKQSNIKGAGKGLFTNAFFKKGEVIGLAHVNGQPTKEVGSNHNHNEKNPTANNIKNGNKRYLIASKNLKPGEEITTNYRLQPELEQPEDFEKKKSETMTPQKDGYRTYSPFKNLPYIDVESDTIDSDNIVYDLKLKANNGLTKFIKKNTGLHTLPGAKVIREIPIKRKGGALLTKRVTCKSCGWKWDAEDGGKDITTCHKCGGQGLVHAQDGGDTDAMTGMMKARLAYANEFGNPAAERMINLPDNPYQFDNGDTGSHYMASMDNYAVPQIQDENGVLQLGDYGPESNEAIRFDSDEDANYFAENYKNVSPGFLNEKQYGGISDDYIEADLNEDEIEEYRRGGFIVEELNNYAPGGSTDWPPASKNKTYLTYSPFYGNSLTGQSSNMGYADNPFSDEESDFFKVNTVRMPQSYIGISGGADPYGKFNHNQGIMKKLGYDAYVGLPYNYDPNNTDYYSNTPSVGGRIRYNNTIDNQWLGIPWNKVYVEASGDYSQSDGLNANFSLGTRFDGKKGRTKGYFEPHMGVSGSWGPHNIKPGAYSAAALAEYQEIMDSNEIPDLEGDSVNMSDPMIQNLISAIYNENIENPLAKGKKQQGAMGDIDLGFKTGFEWQPKWLTKRLPGSKIFGDLRYSAQPMRGMWVSGMGENSQSSVGNYNGAQTSLSDQSETNKLSFSHQFTGGLGLKVPLGTVKDKIENIDFTRTRIPKDCMCPDGTKVDKLEDGSCPCDDYQIEECPPCPDGSVPQRLKDGTCPCEEIIEPDEYARHPRWLRDGGTIYNVKGSKGNYKKINGKWQVDWNRSGKYQPLSKGDVKARTAVLDKMAKPVYTPSPKIDPYAKIKSNSSDNTNLNLYQKEIPWDLTKKYQGDILAQNKKNNEDAIKYRAKNTISNEDFDKENHISTEFPKNATASDYAQRVWEYATNPGTALEYALGEKSGKGPMPFNINQLKEQGVNVNSNSNLVGNMFNMINPLDDIESVRSGVSDIDKGNNSGYLNAGLGILGFLPGGDALKGFKKYGKDLVETSKQAGKFQFPKYKTVYRAEHAGYNKAAKEGSVDGRWVASNPQEVSFYVDKLKDPGSGIVLPYSFGDQPVRIMQQRLPEYEIKNTFGAGMPEEARIMSMGRGEFTNEGLDDLLGFGTGSRFKRQQFNQHDINAMSTAPFLYNKNEGLLDADLINKLRNQESSNFFSSGKNNVFDNQKSALDYLKSEQKLMENSNMFKKYLPFKQGGTSSDYVDVELTPEEIKDLIAQGYVIEELN